MKNDMSTRFFRQHTLASSHSRVQKCVLIVFVCTANSDTNEGITRHHYQQTCPILQTSEHPSQRQNMEASFAGWAGDLHTIGTSFFWQVIGAKWKTCAMKWAKRAINSKTQISETRRS
ncbi:unnamed protein product [Protopolystoma xenopodis]|uniref:Uncharacterized protein n=1 Tax=Protopolystoma xenopodis TaxID=117903 RepID=A0A448WJF9_9PLAT|nr:unnamed protein product [Protopolystoma xenopodis]